ncbi:MAG: HDOD domain-containing protein [Oligoflexia bacterium]|nr:HDOD domain-containing protein [Oligoflexia bacterium]
MNDEHSKTAHTAAEGKAEETKSGGGPFSIQFPPEPTIWNESRKLIADRNTRVENIATCAGQDPVIAMELLRISNAMYFAGGKAPITTLKTAIVRLGNDVVQETLENLKERQPIADEDVSHWFEIHRNKCRRLAIVAKIVGEAASRTLSDDCEAAALLTYVGEMLAAIHLREVYVSLAEEHSRSGVNYRLAQDHKFDVEKMGLTYLRRQGIPEALVFALDREARPRTPDRAIMKPICAAASEMLDAFDLNRWEKLTPGKTLPPKSAVRMLQISDAQYLKVYERVSEFLFGDRQAEERKKHQAVSEVVASSGAAEVPTTDKELESEIESLMHPAAAAEPEQDEEDLETPELPKQAKTSTGIKSVTESLSERNEMFSLDKLRQGGKKVPRVQAKPGVAKSSAPVLRTSKGTEAVSNMASAIDTAQSSEQLLTSLLQMLVDDGPFEKSALIVISKDRKNAIVVAARGPNIGNGQKLALEDPLSPLAKCFSKVQSFGNKSSANSPFGSKSFALAPVDADHDTPVALYADCGNDGALSFEARRVFRTVVDILNQKLPQIPGGIPVEL